MYSSHPTHRILFCLHFYLYQSTTYTMSSNNKTVVGSVLIDRSASMEYILPTLIDALKSFIDEIRLRASVAKECQFRLTTFSNTKQVNFPPNESSPLGRELIFDDIGAVFQEDLAFEASGCTRLIDSAIEEVDILSKRLAELNETGADTNSWFIVLTDGDDNKSSSPARELKRKIESLKEKGVKCILIAANINAADYGELYGFDSTKSVQVDMDVHADNLDAPLVQCFRALSQNIAENMEDDTRDVGFSYLQRAASAPSHFTIDTQPQIPAQRLYRHFDPPPVLRRTQNHASDYDDDLKPPALLRRR